MHFLQAIDSDISVLIVCNKNGGTIKGDLKNNQVIMINEACRSNGRTSTSFPL